MMFLPESEVSGIKKLMIGLFEEDYETELSYEGYKRRELITNMGYRDGKLVSYNVGGVGFGIYFGNNLKISGYGIFTVDGELVAKGREYFEIEGLGVEPLFLKETFVITHNFERGE